MGETTLVSSGSDVEIHLLLVGDILSICMI